MLAEQLGARRKDEREGEVETGEKERAKGTGSRNHKGDREQSTSSFIKPHGTGTLGAAP